MYGATVSEFNCSTVARMPPRADFLIKAMGSTAVATFRRRKMEDAIEVAQEYKKLGAVAVIITTPEGAVVTLEEMLVRISHTAWCVGAANQRKLLCSNDLSPTRRAPRCRQSVARFCLDSQLLKDAK
jgi:hypothetical protein